MLTPGLISILWLYKHYIQYIPLTFHSHKFYHHTKFRYNHMFELFSIYQMSPLNSKTFKFCDGTEWIFFQTPISPHCSCHWNVEAVGSAEVDRGHIYDNTIWSIWQIRFILIIIINFCFFLSVISLAKKIYNYVWQK